MKIFRNNKLFSSFFKAPDLKHLFLNNHTSLTHTQAGYAVFIQTQKLTHTPVCFGSSRGSAGGSVGFVVCHNIRFLCITVYKLRFYGSFDFLSYYTIVFSSSPIFVWLRICTTATVVCMCMCVRGPFNFSQLISHSILVVSLRSFLVFSSCC